VLGRYNGYGFFFGFLAVDQVFDGYAEGFGDYDGFIGGRN
jgi:hypothetical protein